ncbi:MAG: DegT/DnrJ/EryC1/StrS family aminotransferase [Oscillospiraceae bacterium]|nr:DegT/DnrJ/EryC1/StrS family aminotransferase [Oscillospiraceae bacterium]
MKIPFSPPDMRGNEAEYVRRVLESGWITTGPLSKEFEKKISAYCGVERTVCLSSGTAAMELALRVLGVGPGDEVITTPYTFSASAAVIEHVGAKIVFVDVEKDSLFMSPAAVAAAVTPRTKAVIPVDIGGVPCDYDALLAALAAKKQLFRPANEVQTQLGRIAVVGDCAHSFGATYKGKSVARYPDFACFSFHAVKNLTTAEGGAVCFSGIGDIGADELYAQFMLLALHGQNKDALAKTKLGAWEYDILLPGYKCNMTDIMAAIGLAQLERYDEMLARRAEMVARYNEFFDGTDVAPVCHEGADFYGSHHLYITRVRGANVETRGAIIEDMARDGVCANVHYKPLPMMTAYRNLGFDIRDYPNAFDFYRNEITLPLHTLLTDDMIDFAANSCLAAVRAHKGQAYV